MDYNENSLITVSQSIFLRELVFKYPLIGLSEAVGLKANFQILKREVRKEKVSIPSYILQGYPQVPAGWGFKTPHRAHVDNQSEGNIYSSACGEINRYNFYLLT